jgi:hypothetical protein
MSLKCTHVKVQVWDHAINRSTIPSPTSYIFLENSIVLLWALLRPIHFGPQLTRLERGRWDPRGSQPACIPSPPNMENEHINPFEFSYRMP